MVTTKKNVMEINESRMLQLRGVGGRLVGPPAFDHESREFDRFDHVFIIRNAFASNIESRSVINRGADDREAERDIDCVAEPCHLRWLRVQCRREPGWSVSFG